jgi:gas vesicle protein
MRLSGIYRSESSPTNADESKRIKSLISDLQEDLVESQIKTDNKLESMESTITDLQSRFTQMESRFDRWLKESKQVSVIGFHYATSLF